MNVCMPSTLETSLRVSLSAWNGKTDHSDERERDDVFERGGKEKKKRLKLGEGEKKSWTCQCEGELVIHKDPLQGKLFIASPSMSAWFALNSPGFIIHSPAFITYCQPGRSLSVTMSLSACLPPNLIYILSPWR